MRLEPVDSLEIKIKNSPGEVSDAILRMISYCKAKAYSVGLTYKLRLAAEEILVNIVSYSYQDNKEHIIQIRLSSFPETVELEIIDDGIEFNPVNRPNPVELPLEDRQPGGVGIFLVKSMMDNFEYKRVDGKNIITISKKIS